MDISSINFEKLLKFIENEYANPSSSNDGLFNSSINLYKYFKEKLNDTEIEKILSIAKDLEQNEKIKNWIDTSITINMLVNVQQMTNLIYK
jgi:hypothetical protein